MPLPFVLPAGKLTHSWYKALRLRLDREDDEAEQKARDALERRTERSLRQAFLDMQETLYPTGYLPEDPSEELARIHQRFLEDQKLYDAISRAIQDSADLGVSVSIDQLANTGYGFDYTMAHVHARDWANQYTDTLLAQLGTTTANIVGPAVARWVDNGEPLEALIRDLQPAFGRQRAELIASTEVTRAYAEGTVAGYRESGVIKYLEWRTANDELVCPICGPLNGVVVGIEGAFFDRLPDEQRNALGRRVNGRFMRPPAHPRCRCWIVGFVEEVTVEDTPKTETAPVLTTVAQEPVILTPIVPALRPSVTLESDGPVAQRHIADYNRIPDALRDAVDERGVRVYINNDSTLPGIDAQDHLRGVQPRGWPAGMTWDSVPGAYVAGERYVLAGSGRSGASSLLLHEYGHAVGNTLGYDHDDRLIEIHRRQYANLGAYYQQGGPGALAGRQELLAEAFAQTLMDRAKAIRLYSQEMVDFIENVVMQAQEAQIR